MLTICKKNAVFLWKYGILFGIIKCSEGFSLNKKKEGIIVNKKKILALTLALASMTTTALANPTSAEYSEGTQHGGVSHGVSYGTTYNGQVPESNCGHSEAYSSNSAEAYGEGTSESNTEGTTEKSCQEGTSKTSDEGIENAESADKIIAGEKANKKLGVELRYFSPKLKGSIHSDSIHANGGSVDFREDLGLRNTIPSDIKFSYDNMELEWIHSHNIGTTDTNITFNNQNYNADSKVKTNVDYLKFNVANKLYSNDQVDVNWTYGASVYRLDTNIDNGVTNTGKVVILPIPTIGLTAQTNSKNKVNAYIGINGLPLGGYGNIFDIESGLKYVPVNNMSITAGYRILHSSAHKDDKDASFRLSGPFVGIMYAF